jgi:hypothetical protein
MNVRLALVFAFDASLFAIYADLGMNRVILDSEYAVLLHLQLLGRR